MFRLLLTLGLVEFGGPAADRSGVEFFEQRIRPLLVENCYACHGPAKQKAGLRLDHVSTILAGGESGPEILPGDPERSRLVVAVRYTNPELQMPPKGKLGDEAIADLTEWVRRGAPWPDEPPPGTSTRSGGAAARVFDLTRRRSEHWAWRPVHPAGAPAVNDAAWSRGAEDRFVLAKLEGRGIEPAPEAPRRTLALRLAYDLTGLPPAEDELSAFIENDAPDAYEQVVDRLLASPRFGERWGRHWLDLVRYSETLGHEFDYALPNAWRYRDYIIRAFNEDVPYSQLLVEHLAGDLFEPPRRGPDGSNESVIGTAFYWFGQQVHSPVDQRQQTADRIDNQIDVLAKTFLGLTVACARCHDHKFDAIATKDYYAVYSMLISSRYTQAAIDPPAFWEAPAARLEDLLARIMKRAAKSAAPTEASSRTLRAGDVLFTDFDGPDWGDWLPDGPAFGKRPLGDGESVLELESGPALMSYRGGWAHSARLSARFQGALRSPSFTIERRFVHARAAGKSTRINLVIDGFVMIRDPIYGTLKRVIDGGEPHWITIDAERWRGRRAYLELSDLEPTDLGDDGHGEGYGPGGELAVDCVVFSDDPAPPPGWEAPVVRTPIAEDSVATAVRPAASPVAQPTAGGGSAGADELTRLLAEYRAVEASIPAPTFVPAMADGSGEDERVFLRGNPKTPGELAERRLLEAISGRDQQPIRRGSGRLEIARRIADAAGMLVDRVIVNRVWHHLFGRGLVASVDNFGALGQPPSHPELLDTLADRFRREGGSVKQLIRRLVTSSAYRMESRPRNAAAEELDPTNILLHRMPIRRADAEVLRDKILAVSGRLDLAAGGAPVPIHLTSYVEGRGRPPRSGPLDGNGRRSIYLEVRRNFLSPLLVAFDAPLPASTAGRRSVSNLPAQALILLNDPFIAAQAREWATRLLQPGSQVEAKRSPAAQLAAAYRGAFGRAPRPEELEDDLAFIAAQSSDFASSAQPGEAADAEARAWSDLCQVLFNAKEFLYVD